MPSGGAKDILQSFVQCLKIPASRRLHRALPAPQQPSVRGTISDLPCSWRLCSERSLLAEAGRLRVPGSHPLGCSSMSIPAPPPTPPSGPVCPHRLSHRSFWRLRNPQGEGQGGGGRKLGQPGNLGSFPHAQAPAPLAARAARAKAPGLARVAWALASAATQQVSHRVRQYPGPTCSP